MNICQLQERKKSSLTELYNQCQTVTPSAWAHAKDTGGGGGCADLSLNLDTNINKYAYVMVHEYIIQFKNFTFKPWQIPNKKNIAKVILAKN